MFVVIEKVEKKLYVHGPFKTKQDAAHWVDKRKQIPSNNRKYLPRTYSIKEVLKVS